MDCVDYHVAALSFQPSDELYASPAISNEMDRHGNPLLLLLFCCFEHTQSLLSMSFLLETDHVSSFHTDSQLIIIDCILQVFLLARFFTHRFYPPHHIVDQRPLIVRKNTMDDGSSEGVMDNERLLARQVHQVNSCGCVFCIHGLFF